MRALLLLPLLAGAALAEAEPAPAPLKSVPADGAPHLVECKGATYWVAVPRDADPKKPTRVLMWLHGSNMSGRDYVGSLKGLGYGQNEILVGPNGNHKVREWVYNFDYDPKPALKTLEDLETRFALGPVFVGGHSQGAYFTFLLVTKFPERFAGACPFAGGLLKGCDPKAAANRKGRPGPPVAIIHGESDPVVDPELSDWGYEIFLDAEWPRLRYFHPADLNHMFLAAPVKEAIDWMFAMASDDGAELLAAAERFLAADRGSDALFCADRAAALKADAAKAKELREKVLARGAELSEKWAERMRSKADDWSAEIYEARERWARVPSAQPAWRVLEPLRKRQVGDASKWCRDAWAFARKGERDKARELFRKVAGECPAAFEYARTADRWLRDNKG